MCGKSFTMRCNGLLLMSVMEEVFGCRGGEMGLPLGFYDARREAVGALRWLGKGIAALSCASPQGCETGVKDGFLQGTRQEERREYKLSFNDPNRPHKCTYEEVGN